MGLYNRFNKLIFLLVGFIMLNGCDNDEIVVSSKHPETGQAYQIVNTQKLYNIFEGKAVVFEEMVYPDISLMPIDFTYIKSFWEMIEPDLHR
ncbi:hypothetical protein A21D_01563 [Virgibacillus dokdonensis]|uniref:Uncharacterized protein n=2 Tax=Virgibacillus dokdonensis TaxID=302167 RepID=A0A2K9IYW1_9BACI|nr:hypothetical protein A21D_01563 [Virgibacillus dokdonensis]